MYNLAVNETYEIARKIGTPSTGYCVVRGINRLWVYCWVWMWILHDLRCLALQVYKPWGTSKTHVNVVALVVWIVFVNILE